MKTTLTALIVLFSLCGCNNIRSRTFCIYNYSKELTVQSTMCDSFQMISTKVCYIYFNGTKILIISDSALIPSNGN